MPACPKSQKTCSQKSVKYANVGWYIGCCRVQKKKSINSIYIVQRLIATKSQDMSILLLDDHYVGIYAKCI